MQPAGPISPLRGASVEVDVRRVATVALLLCLLALATSAALLFVSGARKNAEITDLRAHGVPVEVTVTGCDGLLGGSGSNPVGYACTGTFTFAGRRHTEAIPGDTLYTSGTTIRGVTVPADPGLLSTPRILATARASASVFVLPLVLCGVLGLGVGAFAWRRRRSGQAGRAAESPKPPVAHAAAQARVVAPQAGGV